MRIVRRVTAWRMHARHTHRADLRRFLTLMRQTTRSGYVNRLRILTGYDVRRRLGEIQSPTLFLASSDDHLVPSVEQARLMARAVPRAAARVLDGHGHVCLVDPDLNLLEIVETWQASRETDARVGVLKRDPAAITSSRESESPDCLPSRSEAPTPTRRGVRHAPDDDDRKH